MYWQKLQPVYWTGLIQYIDWVSFGFTFLLTTEPVDPVCLFATPG